jgi:hypothetical protein
MFKLKILRLESSCTEQTHEFSSYVYNPLKPKLVYIIFKNSVRTAKKTQLFTITKINWLTLFKEIIPVYIAKHAQLINTRCGQNVVTDC